MIGHSILLKVLNDHLTFSDCLEYDGALGSQKTKPGPSVTVKVASYKIFYKDGHAGTWQLYQVWPIVSVIWWIFNLPSSLPDVTGVDVKDKSAKAAPLNWKCTLPKGKGAVNNIPSEWFCWPLHNLSKSDLASDGEGNLALVTACEGCKHMPKDTW